MISGVANDGELLRILIEGLLLNLRPLFAGLYGDEGNLELLSVRVRPERIYNPTAEIERIGENLFKELILSCNAPSIGNVDRVDISRIRTFLQEELRKFFINDPDDLNTLRREDITGGILRIAESFIRRPGGAIQNRANSYILLRLMQAEQAILGMVAPEEVGIYERAEIEFLLHPIDSSPGIPVPIIPAANPAAVDPPTRESSSPANIPSQQPVVPVGGGGDADFQAMKDRLPPVSLPSLFRASTLPDPDTERDNDRRIVTLAESPRAAILRFFDRFIRGDHSHILRRQDLNEADRKRLGELFRYFDQNGDGVLSKSDLIEGFTVMAENFIAGDEWSQETITQYLLRKLNFAIDSLRKLPLLKRMRSVDPESNVQAFKKQKLRPEQGQLAGTDSGSSGFAGGSHGATPIPIGYVAITAVVNDAASATTAVDDATATTNAAVTNAIAVAGTATTDSATTTTATTDREAAAVFGGAGGAAAAAADDGATRRIVQALSRSLGQRFRLGCNIIPQPSNRAPYKLQFGDDLFWFNQSDYGVTFTSFTDKRFIPDQSLLAAGCESLRETNRCFYNHLGVGIGRHPFILQQQFRREAIRRLDALDNEADDIREILRESLESVVSKEQFTDANALLAIWPNELHGFRILVASFGSETQNGGIYPFESLAKYTPAAGPFDAEGNWIGRDIVLHLQFGHFTLLEPDHHSASPWSERPIDAIVDAVKAFVVRVAEGGGRANLQIHDFTVGEYLNDEERPNPPQNPQN